MIDVDKTFLPWYISINQAIIFRWYGISSLLFKNIEDIKYEKSFHGPVGIRMLFFCLIWILFFYHINFNLLPDFVFELGRWTTELYVLIFLVRLGIQSCFFAFLSCVNRISSSPSFSSSIPNLKSTLSESAIKQWIHNFILC